MTKKPPASKSEETAEGKPKRPFWTDYRVTLTTVTNLCSSVPADPDLITKWLEARQPRVKAPGARTVEEVNEEVLASLERGEGEPSQEYSMLVFQSHDGGLVMRAATMKAHMKDCARQIHAYYMGRIEGERAFYTRVANCVYIPPAQYWIPILRPDGSRVTHADGAKDKPVHVIVPGRGAMNALKRFEFIAPAAVLSFNLQVLGDAVKEEDLHLLFQYGGVHGYAGERSDGEGRYDYTLERVTAK